MADTKISALTALTGANTDALLDVFPIVDTSVTTTKKILVSEVIAAMNPQGTLDTTTGGTSIDFTGIPAWATEITLSWKGLSASGVSQWLVRIGDAGGIETSGYEANAGQRGGEIGSTVGFPLLGAAPVAASVYSGSITLVLQDAATFMWIVKSGNNAPVSGVPSHLQGYKATSAALTQISLTTTNGTDTFDINGGVNIRYR